MPVLHVDFGANLASDFTLCIAMHEIPSENDAVFKPNTGGIQNGITLPTELIVIIIINHIIYYALNVPCGLRNH